MKMKNVEDIYALSSMQQLMLWQALAQSRGEVLAEQLTCTLAGPLNLERFREAWEFVVARHPLLRTAFLSQGLKKPVQVVRQKVELPWNVIDFREHDAETCQQQWETLCREDQQQGFDVTKAPLFRIVLAHTADDTWRFLWSCHHLILDGWCLPLVMKEVFTTYAALDEGSHPPLEPARPFRDYVAWLGRQDQTAADEHWQALLEGTAGPPALPFPSPAAQLDADEDRYGEAEVRLDADDAARLQQLASQHKLTLAAMVQGVWSVMLARYSGQADIVSGVTVSGRPASLPGVESIVGPFTNSLPVRTHVNRDHACLPWLTALHAQLLDAQNFQHSAMDQIQAAAGLAAGQRLFDTLVVVENYPLDPRLSFRPGGVEIRDIRGTASAAFPLTLIAIPGAELTLRLRYDRRRFSTSTGERILGHVAAALARLSHGIPKTVGALFVIPQAEQERIDQLAQVPADAPCGPPAAGHRVHVADAWGPSPIEIPGRLYLISADPGNSESASQREHTPWQARWRVIDSDGEEQPADSQPDAPSQPEATAQQGMLEYLGRDSDPLEVDIYRVDPAEMAAVLAGHRLVVDAAVVAQVNQHGERRLVAYVVTDKESATVIDPEQQATLLPELRKYLKKQLPHRPLPAVIKAVDAIPRTEDGAVDIGQLPSLSRPRPESCGPPVPPRSRLEARLVEIWSDSLGIQPIGVTDNFQDLGGTSLDAVAMVGRIEEQFARKVPLVSLVQHPTIENLARLLRRSGDDAGESSLVPIRATGTRPPLFCIHPAGGTIYCYLALAKHLPDEIPIYGLQARGIDGEAAPHTTVIDMARYYADAIRTVQPEGPYQICGWSSGGIMTFEVARQLEAQGQELSLVALFDAGMRKPGQTFDERDFLPMLLLLFPHEDAEFVEQLQRKSAEEQLAYFRDRAELAKVVMQDTEHSIAQHIFAVFQANVKAIVEYEAQPCRSRLTVFRAEEKATPMHEDPELGWGPWAGGGVEVIEVPGNHVSMFREPTILTVAEHLERLLMQDQPAPSTA